MNRGDLSFKQQPPGSIRGVAMRKMLFLLGLIVLLFQDGYAQTAATYTFSRSTGAYTSISGTGTSIPSINCDDCHDGPIPLGFSFTFCGVSYSSCYVSSNGVVSLAAPSMGYFSCCGITASDIQAPAWFMPLWADDAGVGAGGSSPTAYYLTTGSPGSRIFTVEYQDWATCCFNDYFMNFQVKLYEGSNKIEFCYGTVGTPQTATIGIANSTTDFQTLPSTGSPTCNTTFNGYACINPGNGEILTWSVPCVPGSAMPAIIPMIGGGGYCSGGAGVNIGLAGSAVGIDYQLYLGGVPVGSPVAGIGSTLSFGLQTVAGTYTATATNNTTGCTSSMSGSKTVTIYPLPTIYTVTGGGSYCAGGSGVTVGMSSSDIGVNYQLYRGGLPVVGTITAGTGTAFNFAPQTIAGTYTVVAKMAGFTGCTENMTGSATVTIDLLPSAYMVTGGGSYCAGGTGMAVGLSNSDVGVDYQLYRTGGIAVGAPVPGTGAAISFGNQTMASTYTAKALNTTTGCRNNMGGSVSVNILPMPVVYTVTGGGGYCTGGAGALVGLSGSTAGVNYQLYLGGSPVGSPVGGTGSAISFGPQSSAGVYTVVATNASSGCTSSMSGSVTVSINPLPNIYTVTGGGLFCAGGTGLPVGLASSDVGVNYQLYRGGTTMVGGPIGGTGSAITFGIQNIAGTYTVRAYNPATTCTEMMSGSAIITISPLPAAIAMTGGGGYCSGGVGVAVGLAASATGISYQLLLGGSPVGSPVLGTGGALSFGLQTTAGIYTVTATDLSTGCMNTMPGSKTVTIYTLPTAYTMTGGGNYCAGGTGVTVGLSGSQTGTSYQLYLAGLPVVGAMVTGTGSAISFGLRTAAGTYTAVATIVGPSACANNMTGSSTVAIDPLPTVYALTGGGGYCAGGSGSAVGLAGSDAGVDYQLYRGTTAVGTPVAGTGSAISFGLQTVAGTYTVKGTDATTGCVNTMGSVPVSINALPTAMTVTGGGSYCPGGAGVLIGLAGTTSTTTYQLYVGATPVGSPITGVGTAISFGLQTTTGTYTVVGTSTINGCTNSMANSVTVSIASLPTAYTVTGGGTYCAGGSGVAVGLSSSSTGTQYQLFLGATAVGAPVTGTGGALNFGLKTAAGTYTVVATSTGTLCTNNMTGSATITITPVPTVYAVTGGGAYCIGGSGVPVYLTNSQVGVNYQLYLGATPVGGPVAGTGSAISFGSQTTAGTYTVVANPGTMCPATMSGSATVSIIALPTAYTVTGGGGYCAGGSGVPVYLTGSQTGINYQLYVGATPVGTPMAGTTAALSFGLQTAAGPYTVVATTASGSCTATMTGSVNVTVNSVPSAYTVTGGGSYCSGGTGVAVGLTTSDAGVNYQLYRGGTTAVGSPVAGTGSAITFGNQTVAGTYTVKGVAATGGCITTMSGSVGVTINALPAVVSMSGGGGYCSGGSGVAVGLLASASGVSYQLMLGGSPVGSPVTGTGLALSFGLQTTAGTYTVVATNGSGCSSTMAGSKTVYINANPTVYTVTGGGGYCSGGTGVRIYLSGSNSGITYKLTRGGTPVISVSGTGAALDMGLYTTAGTYAITATASGTGCISTMSGTAIVTVNPNPTVTGSIYTLMPGASITYTGSIAGGTWTSSNLAVATVGASTGIITGVSLGTSMISYTLPTGCSGAHLASVTPTGFRPAPAENASAVGTAINILPNPTKGVFTVRGTIADGNSTDVYIQVTDMAGRSVYSANAIALNGDLKEEVNLGNVASGMYLVNVKAGNEHKVFHLVVEQ